MATTHRSEPRAGCRYCNGSGIVSVSKDPDEVTDCVCTDPPRRVQLSRRAGWRKPENTIVVARPSRWGNPWRVRRVDCHEGGLCWGTTEPNLLGDEVTAREHCDTKRDATECAVTSFRHAILYPLSGQPQVPDPDEIRRELAGKNLACWCPLDEPCHADVLLEIANGGGDV